MGQAVNTTIPGDKKLQALAANNWASTERYNGKKYSDLSAVDQHAVDQAFDELTTTTTAATMAAAATATAESTDGGAVSKASEGNENARTSGNDTESNPTRGSSEASGDSTEAGPVKKDKKKKW